MPVSLFTSSGQPSDAVGADGDLNWDFLNRITWGPKGKVSPGSWAGTAYSNIGPTGPAMLSGAGAPSSSIGQNGNGYTDVASGLTYLKANNAWTQLGNILGPPGPVGAQGVGAIQLTNGYGPGAAMSNTTLSATPLEMGVSGPSVPSYFIPTANTSLMGATFAVSGSSANAVTWQLYDKTAGAPIISVGTAVSSITSPTYAPNQYPLIGGNTYVWRATGSGAAFSSVAPQYQFTSNYTTNLSQAGTALFSSGGNPAALSTSPSVMLVPGVTLAYYYKNGFSSSLSSATFTIVASGSFSAQFVLLRGSATASGTTVAYTSPVITSTGPTLVNNIGVTISPNIVYTWGAIGSGSIAATVAFQVQQ